MTGNVSGIGQRPPKEFNITITAGADNSLELKFGGNCIGYSIIAPSSAATYSVKFEFDSYPLDKKEGLTGDHARWHNFQMYYDFQKNKGPKCTIYNATNGAYKVMAWYSL